MTLEKKKYDTTLARMAGNIAAGFIAGETPHGAWEQRERFAEAAVAIARAIVAEIEKTEPKPETATVDR